jgi:CheY-like chemotaxis protein
MSNVTDLTTTKPLITILIVDDSESDRLVYCRYLQSDRDCNYRILEAETLEEGLELWQSETPDAVLVDYRLPDGDGLEFLEILAEGKTDPKLPISYKLRNSGLCLLLHLASLLFTITKCGSLYEIKLIK